MKLQEAYKANMAAGRATISAGKIKCTYVVLNDRNGKKIFSLDMRGQKIKDVQLSEEQVPVIRDGKITNETRTVTTPYVVYDGGLLTGTICYAVDEANEQGLVQVVISGLAAVHMQKVVELAQAQGKTIGSAYQSILDGSADIYVRADSLDWEPITEDEIEYPEREDDEEPDVPTPSDQTKKKRNLLLAIAAGLLLLNQ